MFSKSTTMIKIPIKNYAIIIVLLFIQSKGFSQKLYIKTNILNSVFARPTLSIEYQLNNKSAIAINAACGTSFFYKRDIKPFYTFKTITIDIIRTIYKSKKVYAFRYFPYAGIIQRKIYQDEKTTGEWPISITRNGRDFNGLAIRCGIGLSNFVNITSRISLEYNMGGGIGKYISFNDSYYTNVAEPSPYHVIGYFLDYRMALNFCYKLF